MLNKLSEEFINLKKVCVKNNRVDYFFDVSKNLKKFFQNNFHMFIEFDENIESIPISILVIPFVSNLAPLSWLTNSVLWIPEIDEEYYKALYRIKSRYQDMYLNYKLQGVVIPAKVIKNNYEVERESAQLFSGGLDAIVTNIRIKEKNPLLINIYGWYHGEVCKNNVFDSDKKNILEFSNINELESKFIKSNFATFIKADVVNRFYMKKLKDSWWHGLQHGMSFIGHAIPLLYKYKIENLYVASSFSLGGRRYSCSSDPVVDIETKYASGKVIHDGFELIRQEKIKLVVDKKRELKRNYILRVCSFNYENCCQCEKCFRTILGLIAEGVDKKELTEFGFEIDKDLCQYFNEVMNEKLHFLGVERESKIHWPAIKKRMINNESNIIEKEFVEWFFKYDFIKKRKKAVLRYRIKNCIPILKRRILGEK